MVRNLGLLSLLALQAQAVPCSHVVRWPPAAPVPSTFSPKERSSFLTGLPWTTGLSLNKPLRPGTWNARMARPGSWSPPRGKRDQSHQNYMDTELWEGEGCLPHKTSDAHPEDGEMDAGQGKKYHKETPDVHDISEVVRRVGVQSQWPKTICETFSVQKR